LGELFGCDGSRLVLMAAVRERRQRREREKRGGSISNAEVPGCHGLLF
jgi:hypothetical protein